MDYKRLFVIMSVTLILASFTLFFIWLPTTGESVFGAQEDDVINVDLSKYRVVIDSGHGGIDPGKLGVNGCLEKDINLDIAKQLQSMLQLQGIEVVMTRTEDLGLYSESDTNKKRTDLYNRCELVNKSQADITVSIHQNSYSSEAVSGAQVFYYGKSDEGQKLALIIQNNLKDYIDKENNRVPKANNEYYLLKNTNIPTVIVECGFLSNNREAGLLCTSEYQNKLAHAIYMGILEYIFTNKL